MGSSRVLSRGGVTPTPVALDVGTYRGARGAEGRGPHMCARLATPRPPLALMWWQPPLDQHHTSAHGAARNNGTRATTTAPRCNRHTVGAATH